MKPRKARKEGKATRGTQNMGKVKNKRFYESTKKEDRKMKRTKSIVGVLMLALVFTFMFASMAKAGKGFGDRGFSGGAFDRISPDNANRNPWRPIRPPRPCFMRISMWVEPEQPHNVYFTDEDVTIHYRVRTTCGADSVFVGPLEHHSAEEALAAAEGEYPTGGGSWGTSYRDPAEAGMLVRSIDIPAGSDPGVYTWRISARKGTTRRSNQMTVRIISKPEIDESCLEVGVEDCLLNMLRYIASEVHTNITENEELDEMVEAFRLGLLDRRTFGLELEYLLEAGKFFEYSDLYDYPLVILCHDRCCPGGSCSGDVFACMCANGRFSDYALLHEIVHALGFNSNLIDDFMGSGHWDWTYRGSERMSEYQDRIEEMTCIISGQLPSDSLGCSYY